MSRDHRYMPEIENQLMALVADSSTAREHAKALLDEAYEWGYQDGESSAEADREMRENP